MLFRFLPSNISETVMYTGFQAELEAEPLEFPNSVILSGGCASRTRSAIAVERPLPVSATAAWQGVSITAGAGDLQARRAWRFHMAATFCSEPESNRAVPTHL